MSTDSISAKLPQHSLDEAKFIIGKHLMEAILEYQLPIGLQAISSHTDYYTDHGIGHIQRVIGKLEALDQFLSIRITQKEAFILLMAVYFHDIGMFLGRRESEDAIEVRADHHIRSGEIIQWLKEQNYLNLGAFELSIIRRIIEAHRITDLQQLAENQRISGTTIRTRLLGALLRIADSCDCDSSRAPKAIFELFYEHIPERSREYWQTHFPVTDVSFDERRSSIVISVDLNADLRDRIERYRMVNSLRKKLDEELESVEVVFRHNGISLTRVEIIDFNRGDRIDLSSLPVYEDIITVTLRSNFDRVDQFVNVINEFASNASSGIRLIIEIRPPEGPMYIDSEVNIGSDRLEEVIRRLRETLGTDLRDVSGEEVEKMTIRRGTAN